MLDIYSETSSTSSQDDHHGEPAFGGGHGVPHSASHTSARASDVPWTPYSAVSSFNLPAHYDSTLITPITMAPSPNISSRPAPTARERDIKLSPSMESPDYPLFGGGEDDFGSRLGSAPMKQKGPSSNNAKIPTSEPNYPTSPTLFCTSPYYGAFGVSATPKSGRAAELTSPKYEYQSSKVNNPAPILIAPNPNTMRPATRPGDMPYRDNMQYGRHDSMHSMHSIATPINSYHSTPPQYPEQQIAPIPNRRKRKGAPHI
ncbi:hypothetical protein H4I96_01459 [Botrytis cinerea]